MSRNVQYQNNNSRGGTMKTFKEYQEDDIREVLMGHRVVKVEIFDKGIRVEGAYSDAKGKLTLDDGREVYVIPNEGGCSCGAGDYDLTSLERVDNIITRVDFESNENGDENGDDSWEMDTSYRIFVLAGHERINLLTVVGGDGNGYYGTGYELVVTPVRN